MNKETKEESVGKTNEYREVFALLFLLLLGIGCFLSVDYIGWSVFFAAFWILYGLNRKNE